MKTTVIHHSADYDGIFCREIARKFLPEAELIGWNFGDKQIPMPTQGKLIIMDLPCDEPFGWKFPNTQKPMDQIDFSEFIWIDHHKSAIESHPARIPGYRIDGVAACRLAWQWFANPFPTPNPTPQKQDFVDRRVSEPLAVRLAGEYDIWDKRDPDADTFQYGLRLVDQGADFWEALLRTDDVGIKAVEETLGNGRIAQRYSAKIDADVVNYRSYTTEWEGLKFLTMNIIRCNSLSFSARDIPATGHDALLGYYFNGKVWTVSLYHAKHRTDLDLSQIAVKYGGGGHRGACGFTCSKLPFL